MSLGEGFQDKVLVCSGKRQTEEFTVAEGRFEFLYTGSRQ